MATCAICSTKIVFGGITQGEARYCSAACAARQFLGQFQQALIQAAQANPRPLPDVQPLRMASGLASDEPEFTPLADSGKDLMVVLIGSGVCLAISALVYFLVMQFGYAFHSQTLWFVIPVGAYFCGLLAGGGFWFALRALDQRPGKHIFLAAGLAGVVGYLMIYFLMWWLMEFQGVAVREQVGFVPFLQYVLEHQRIRVRHGVGDGFEVGAWGYPRFAINTAGFTFGVISALCITAAKTYCPRCKRYLRTVAKQSRTSSDPESSAAALHPVLYALSQGRVQEAVDLHARSGSPHGKAMWTTQLLVEACPGCKRHVGTLSATVKGDQGHQKVEGFVFQGITDGPGR